MLTSEELEAIRDRVKRGLASNYQDDITMKKIYRVLWNSYEFCSYTNSLHGAGGYQVANHEKLFSDSAAATAFADKLIEAYTLLGFHSPAGRVAKSEVEMQE